MIQGVATCYALHFREFFALIRPNLPKSPRMNSRHRTDRTTCCAHAFSQRQIPFFGSAYLARRVFTLACCALRGISGGATMAIEALVGSGSPILPGQGSSYVH